MVIFECKEGTHKKVPITRILKPLSVIDKILSKRYNPRPERVARRNNKKELLN
jgi:hypothetical protein